MKREKSNMERKKIVPFYMNLDFIFAGLSSWQQSQIHQNNSKDCQML
jgi:hypothetical protein